MSLIKLSFPKTYVKRGVTEKNSAQKQGRKRAKKMGL